MVLCSMLLHITQRPTYDVCITAQAGATSVPEVHDCMPRTTTLHTQGHKTVHQGAHQVFLVLISRPLFNYSFSCTVLQALREAVHC